MANFNPCLIRTLRHEGVVFTSCDDFYYSNWTVSKTGYTDHPDDPGRETNFGIKRGTAIQAGYCANSPMSEMSLTFAGNTYRRLFWNPIMGDELPDQDIAYELFDTAVNCGLGTAIKFLQRTLNILNEKATLWPDIVADGWMGSGTMTALKAALASRPWMKLCILRTMDNMQGTRYIMLAEGNEKFESFYPGWIRLRCGIEEGK